MTRASRARRASGLVPVIIAGGGIAGLAVGLTLHQIGIRCMVFESARQLRPLGVGLNLQPNAVRELADLGLRADWLDRLGAPIREWALVGLTGHEIHVEPRGLDAGYRWAQYAVHRGRLHMALARAFMDRAGEDAYVTGHRATAYAHEDDGTVTLQLVRADARVIERRARLVIGADGIHSMLRAQMHPNQPPINWNGAIMWRGVTRARPVRGGAAFVGLGTSRHRMVFYPLSKPDRETGLSEINWIAERTVNPEQGWQKSGWYKPVPVSDFAHHFECFGYEGLDVPALLAGAETTYENPMIDREPIDTWVDRRVALIGDAAHPMFPTGSNGASQAIIDARVLGACLLEHGLTPEALADYDARLCGPISKLVLANREAGPFGLLDLVDQRCGGVFDDIEDVVPAPEREAFMARYRDAAGMARARVNTAAPIIPPGARIGTAV
jgi:2-polyprenyl-6-methoxyphenol hydroxylase-like FAD-dependent oxidoreductase